MQYSSFLSQRIADREVGKQAERALAAREIVYSALDPVTKRFVAGQRLPKDGVVKAANEIASRFGDSEATIFAQATRYNNGRKFSANENAYVRALLMSGYKEDRNRGWLSFYAYEITVQRKRMLWHSLPLNFEASEHCFSRFLERKGGNLRSFADEIRPALLVSLPLCMAVLRRGTDNNVAVPMADGLCFGKIFSQEERETPMGLSIDQRGAISIPSTAWAARLKEAASWLCEIKTFVHGKALNEQRLSLWKLLVEYENRHPEAIQYLFDNYYFGGHVRTILERPISLDAGRAIVNEEVGAMVKVMLAEADQIVASPEWSGFVRAHLHAEEARA